MHTSKTFAGAVLLGLAVFCLQAHGQKSSGQEAVLYGFWNDMYPVASAEYGYYFSDDGTYIYFEPRDLHLKAKYDGRSGRWRIEDGRIYILPERDYYWREPFYNPEYEVQSPGKSNYLFYLPSEYTDWQLIGELGDYVEEDKAYATARKSLDWDNFHPPFYPPTLKLKYIREGLISERTWDYTSTKTIDMVKDSWLNSKFTELLEAIPDLPEWR